MHWLEQYKTDFGFKTNYRLAKESGISERSLDSIKRRLLQSNGMKKETFVKLANAASLSLDEFENYLKKVEGNC